MNHAEEPKNAYRYRVLRYTPNSIRDEWVNIGVLLEEPRREWWNCRGEFSEVIEDQSEMARVKKLHPNADERTAARASDGIRCAPARGAGRCRRST